MVAPMTFDEYCGMVFKAAWRTVLAQQYPDGQAPNMDEDFLAYLRRERDLSSARRTKEANAPEGGSKKGVRSRRPNNAGARRARQRR